MSEQTRYEQIAALSPIDENWVRSDAYHNSFLIKPDGALEHALKASDENGLPQISVSTAQGKLLSLLVKAIGAKRILEVGTLGGYSTIWLARALPEGGKIVTTELKQKHADVARANFEYAGVSSKVDIIVGPAAETLAKLDTEPPFDFAFIDADKPNNVVYYNEARKRVRKGGIIIVDNTVWRGAVANPDLNSADINGIRDLLKAIKEDAGVEATTIATVGEKGFDGFTYIAVL